MDTVGDFKRRLLSAPVAPLRGVWQRIVPFAALAKSPSPNWLFTSGKPNRYNPASVECVYFAEDEATARAEHDDYWAGMPGEKQPVVLYHAEVVFERALDLGSAETVKAIGLKERDLFASWRGARRPTPTQLLGQAVSEQHAVPAIRYPSRAARDAGFSGHNLVIFPSALRPPDSLCILGPAKKPLQRWP